MERLIGLLQKMLGMKKNAPGEILFVYGSLKKGFMNHERFGLHNQKFLGSGEIPCYRMYSLRAYPCVVFTADARDRITCEIYEVDRNTMDRIRYIEHGAGYKEQIIATPRRGVCNGRAGSIFVYDRKPEHARIVESGVWQQSDQTLYFR